MGSRMIRYLGPEEKPLCRPLWGYRTLEELEPDSGIPYWCGFVRTLKGVFLDEVV